MDWFLTILGIILLIVLHEAGHFFAAKAVGMRVERFSLFFPPTIAKFRRGETEYAIGSIPLGGYVKITGMSPMELEGADLRTAHRSYYMKAPWKRIVVILAGPAVNLVIAFVLFAFVLLSGGFADGKETLQNLNPGLSAFKLSGTKVGGVIKGYPAEGVLKPGDEIRTVEGKPATENAIVKVVETHRCSDSQVEGCRAPTPVELTVRRDGKTISVSVRPRYDAKDKRMLIGFDFEAVPKSFGLGAAVAGSASSMWAATTETVAGLGRALTSSKERKHLSSLIGITEVTEDAVASGLGRGLVVLGYVSLILGVLNLFPFLPLDGGHIVWSLAEKVRGRRVSMATMWRVSSVGLLLMAFLVINGLSNDISRIAG
jgi:regulator of sigma E protease